MLLGPRELGSLGLFWGFHLSFQGEPAEVWETSVPLGLRGSRRHDRSKGAEEEVADGRRGSGAESGRCGR